MKQNKKPRDIFGELGKIFEDAYPGSWGLNEVVN